MQATGNTSSNPAAAPTTAGRPATASGPTTAGRPATTGAPTTAGEPTTPALMDRLAGAPISWGVCEVPGWGRMLPPDRVFAEMAELGLRATELGPIGYLPFEPAAVRAALDRHGLRLVGGFVPLVLHEPTVDRALAEADRIATVLAGAGAELFVAAAVADEQWSKPKRLTDREWDAIASNLARIETLAAEHGLTLALHPHAGTQLETKDDVERMLAASDVGWCLDTGHLMIGGVDPAEFVRRHAGRIVHAHLKDVDAGIAARLRAEEMTLVEAVRAGLFRPLGRGDAPIGEVVELLGDAGYERWLVLEQDTAVTGEEPPVGQGPVIDVRASIDYLKTPAPRRERVPR